MLRARGINDAVIYDPRDTSIGGTHAMFIFRGRPEDYNLPAAPEVPTVNLKPAWQSAAAAAGMMLAGVVLAFLSNRSSDAPVRNDRS